MDKMINGRPAKTAEQTLSKIMSNDDKLSNKEKQDLMADFIKHFFNEDGTLNEKALFEMFMVNKELHENLSRTRDTVSYLRDQLYEYQKSKGTAQTSPHQKNPFIKTSASGTKSSQCGRKYYNAYSS
ncbi:predicted protein [Naegleria gruberi]|uniref:Predicted protein n=1 Tax=Naegleria gruberi TaxID=5762 RepID=D2UXQ0_NAEGR|nr:uncharacterized protein NAEGRDRAFT_77698 [Naegleria gruberi]EFC50669.1 predicted protein [Naegleria gruberi]|eukprot:XP_002683413.1 predicted protein [Naegleria gruberi strain NEG-M]